MLKLIKNDKTDVQLIGFEGDKIENLINPNHLFNHDDGLEQRLDLWKGPHLLNCERIYGSESILLIHDKDMNLLPFTNPLNSLDLKLSSMIVALEILSMELSNNHNFNSITYNKLQIKFCEHYLNNSTIKNMLDIEKSQIIPFNKDILNSEISRLAGTTLYVSSTNLPPKFRKNENFEILPSNKMQLLELALLEAKQYSKIYAKIFEILNFRHDAVAPEFILNFINEHKNTDFSLSYPEDLYNTEYLLPMRLVL